MADGNNIVLTGDQEAAVMRDAFKLLKFYSNVPELGSSNMAQYWNGITEDLLKFGSRHDNNELCLEIGAAIFSYLEKKMTAKSKGEKQ